MTSSSRIIKGGDVSGEFVSWHAPAVAEEIAAAAVVPDDSHVDPNILRDQARQEGFEQGRAEGIAAGKAELAEQAQLLGRVLDNLARPLQELDHQFEDELLALISAIAQQLVRRELRQDPSHVVSIIREGLAALPSGAADIRVRLHPQDADAVRSLLTPDEPGRSWQIEADPLMEQGGCQIVSATAQIDGRLETRLNRVVATMLEDERASRD